MTTATAFDVAAVRKDFPILHQTGSRPSAGVSRQRRQQPEAASRHRRDQPLLHLRLFEYPSRRPQLERALHASITKRPASKSSASSTPPIRREIIFVRGTTEGINLVAQTWGRQHIGAGDEIVITALEHHSNIVPWQMLCEENGAHSRRSRPSMITATSACDEFERRLELPRTELVAVAHVSNVLGTILPIARSSKLAHSCQRSGAGRRSPSRAHMQSRRPGTRLPISTPSRATNFTAPPASASCTAKPPSQCHAPLSGRRRHDPFGNFREDHLQHAALQIRSRNAGYRRSRSDWPRPSIM